MRKLIATMAASLLALTLGFTSCDTGTNPSGNGNINPPQITEETSVITIITHPADTNVIEGKITQSLSIVASISGAETILYQWFSKGDDAEGEALDGATSASFNIPSILTEGEYKYFCVVSADGEVESVTSNIAIVTVAADEGDGDGEGDSELEEEEEEEEEEVEPSKITITAQSEDTIVTFGEIEWNLFVTATVTRDETLSYQWFLKGDDSEDEALEGATSDSYDLPEDLKVGEHLYYCVVSADGEIESVNSEVITVTVEDEDVE